MPQIHAYYLADNDWVAQTSVSTCLPRMECLEVYRRQRRSIWAGLGTTWDVKESGDVYGIVPAQHPQGSRRRTVL